MSKNKIFPLLSTKEQSLLQDALHYVKIAELKEASKSLSLSHKGKKGHLINAILTFINSGNILEVPKMPARSLVKNHTIQLLAPSSLMLYGAYKNDLKTRNFFKKLIGPQFHFTAFGIDWLNDRWLQGNPPTYEQFANFWKTETVQRKKEGTKPKDEWMFIRFMQKMEAYKPHASKEDLLNTWKELQQEKKEKAFELLKKTSKKLIQHKELPLKDQT